MNPAELTEPEQLLWTAFPRGTWVDLSGSRAGGPSVIRAAVISALLLGIVPAEPGSTAGIRLRGATATGLSVDGDVDCSHLEARGAVTFQTATVTGALDLTGARIASPGGRGLVLSYATIGGKVDGRDLAVEGETRANNCRVAAHVSMAAARLDNAAGVAFFCPSLT